MDYNELVKNLRSECAYALPSQTRKALCEAADAIEKLQKDVIFHKFNSEFWEDKYNSLSDEKWIPVTEALPEEPGTYLVCVHEPLEKEGCLAEYNMSYVDLLLYDAEQGVWQNGQYDAYNAHLEFVDKKRTYFISHWQEKPALPKEVS